ncbi:MAG: heparan-alpha-glucosaminide N-acetyltransferase [Methanocorpusculum sp.]|nr:heparan-alpha-glucosaminide N-acetyltransferase [Methanocorpusculum sp.]
MRTSVGKRYWEIDALRGFALLLMIFFHTFACMVMFHMIDETPAFMQFYQFYLTSTVTFVTVAGVSLILRHARIKGSTKKSYIKSVVIKATVLFVIAMIITLVTWAYSVLVLGGGAFIQFGFLHMLSISMVLALPFLRFGKWNIFIGGVLICAGIFLLPLITEPAWLFPVGIHSAQFLIHSMEYFPLLPWFGVLLLGAGVGSVLYPNGIRRFHLRECGAVGHALAKIGNGKVTLVVYLAHAPVIMLILWIISTVTGIGGV